VRGAAFDRARLGAYSVNIGIVSHRDSRFLRHALYAKSAIARFGRAGAPERISASLKDRPAFLYVRSVGTHRSSMVVRCCRDIFAIDIMDDRINNASDASGIVAAAGHERIVSPHGASEFSRTGYRYSRQQWKWTPRALGGPYKWPRIPTSNLPIGLEM
jgi:hypothetical protein